MEAKIEYVKHILLSCLEGSGLFDFYIYEIKSLKIEYEDLRNILVYLLEKKILIIYAEDQRTKLNITDSKRLLEEKEIWENYKIYNPLIITNPYGMNYYYEKLYEKEILNSTFVNFKLNKMA